MVEFASCQLERTLSVAAVVGFVVKDTRYNHEGRMAVACFLMKVEGQGPVNSERFPNSLCVL